MYYVLMVYVYTLRFLQLALNPNLYITYLNIVSIFFSIMVSITLCYHYIIEVSSSFSTGGPEVSDIWFIYISLSMTIVDGMIRNRTIYGSTD